MKCLQESRVVGWENSSENNNLVSEIGKKGETSRMVSQTQ